MKNSEQPASPCLMQQIGENSYRANMPSDPIAWNVPCAGLTKREYFAAIAMQGLFANQYFSGNVEQTVHDAVYAADKLLVELAIHDESPSVNKEGGEK